MDYECTHLNHNSLVSQKKVMTKGMIIRAGGFTHLNHTSLVSQKKKVVTNGVIIRGDYKGGLL